jgi:DNA-binding NarL/FixJ family response regulator
MLIRLYLGEEDDLEVVAEADGAASALALLAGARPDVVLLDARMPVVDGFELAKQLLATRGSLRVAILTSMVDEVVRAKATAAGAHRCISKGDLSELPQIVRGLMALKA